MADDRPTVSSGRLPAGEISQRSFGVVRRGFDPDEVRAYLELLARELHASERREQELLHELSSAEERARNPVIDEGVLSHALGQRSAAVLRNAHEEAARIALTAEETAAAVVRESQQQATETQVSAESQAAERIAEAELEANALRQQARDEAAAMLDAARAEGEGLIERARDHGRAMVDQAQDARRRVLADMAHRRRLMTEQIEQFRAARDEIASSIVGVRHSVDRIVDDLARADDAARAAAADAARHITVDAPEAVLVAEGEQAAAELGADSGAGLAAADDVLSRPVSPQVSIRFDDIATVVERPPGSQPDEGGWSPLREAGRSDARPASHAATVPGAGHVDPLPQASAPSHDPGGSTSDVDGLFARLRARQGAGAATATDLDAAEREPQPGGPSGQEASPAPATTGNRPPSNGASPADADAAGADAVGTDAQGADAQGADAKGADAKGADAGTPASERGASGARGRAGQAARGGGQAVEANGQAVEQGGQAPEEGGQAAQEPGVDAEEPTAERAALDRRAAVLDPVVTTMARRLKRALQDDQNGLLDRLRQGPGTWSDELLPDEGAQRSLYAKAAAGAIRDSVVAGTTFARATLGGRQGRPPAPDQRTVDTVTEELAGTVVTLLRRRLEGGDVPDAAERIGAAYREWRGERIERLAEDRAIEAFGAGVLAGSAKSGGVRWVRGDSGPGCADCEDNALAETVPTGEAFPTGHRHPPAHAGCRCLVVPAPR